MSLVQAFKEYEDYSLSKEKQDEFVVQKPYVEPWELKPLAIPGLIIGFLIAPFISVELFMPSIIGLAILTGILMYKVNQEFSKLFASSYFFIFAVYFVLFNLCGLLLPSVIIVLNCILLAYTMGIFSITIQIPFSDLMGGALDEKRKSQLDLSYSNKYLRYRYFRKFWDSQLKKIVEEIQSHPEFGQSVKRWYNSVQSLEAINERRIFLQKELDFNSSLITSKGLPLTETDISASRYSDKVFALQIEIDTKIDTLIEEINQKYLDITTRI